MTAVTALFSVTAIREIERSALHALPEGSLMERAGQAAASFALTLLPANKQKYKILIVAGPGNNGGDALIAAVKLQQRGVSVLVLFESAAERLPPDARNAFLLAEQAGVEFASYSYFLNANQAPEFDLVIDGLFGIGLTRAVTGEYARLIESINSLSCPVLALDLPSGLDADTGMLVGDGPAVQASHTISFIGNKPGLHTGHGRDYAGVVQIADLDIEERYFPPPSAGLNHVALFSTALKPRLHSSHKGSYGKLAILGGSFGMQGAAILASRTALKTGAGRVYIGFIDMPPQYDGAQPELMCRRADELSLQSYTVVAGPGMGQSARAQNILQSALATDMPLVLDADALNMLAGAPELKRLLAQRRSPTLLTPHPLEAARLLNVSTKEVQSNRLQAAQELANCMNAIVVLKGSGTIIAACGKQPVINTTGNPGLATAGTGDVLAGMCGALLAQGWDPWRAALGAVWIHGKAADLLVDQAIGPIGLSASELIPEMRHILNRLVHDPHAFQ